MMYILGLFGINFSVEQALRTLMGNINAIIYSLIDYLYNVFIYLSKAQILESDFIQSIYSKVGMILGLFMIFKLTFSLIQSLIDPNKFTDKKSGYSSIVFRAIIAIVLLGTTPAIFKEAFEIQNLIVGGENSDNIIYKLISGHSSVKNKNMGRVISADIYFSFFTDNEIPKLDYEVGTEDKLEFVDKSELENTTYDRFYTDDYGNLVKSVKDEQTKNFHDTVDYLVLKSSDQEYYIEFNWLLLLITGCFVVWIMAMYCIQVAIRVSQLAYLQLIAPIPILSYISDPEGTFKKWVNQCVSTYLDLFFRLAIIYFVCTMIGDVIEQFDPNNTNSLIINSTGIPSSEGFTLILVKIFIVIGLLLFAKKVPELLKDLFPNMGGGAGKFSFGLNPKKEVFEPLKQLYNTTPLGWAPKALGWSGKKLIGAYDRHKYNLPKPRGKFGQAIDKLTPGRAEYLKNMREAQLDAKNWEAQEQKGKEIYDQFNGELIDKDSGRVKNGVFRSADYISTFEAKANAKKNVKEAEKIIRTLNEDITRASTDTKLTETERTEKLRILRAQRENAESNLRAAEGELTIAEERHKKNQAIYTKDAKTEKLFKMYDDLHKPVKDINDGVFDPIETEVRRRQEQAEQNRKNMERAQQQFNELNGIGTDSKSDNSKVTAENSLLAELAEKAHQKEMQEEFLNRKNDDNAS